MNKLASEAAEYLRQLKAELPASQDYQVFVVMPYTALWKAVETVQDSPILIGAQNMHWADEGPYTGEISPKMLAEIGIHLVELGHSDRRALYNETDQDVNQKVKAALKHRLTPLVCIGERLSEKNFGASADFLSMQLRIALHGLSPAQAELVWVAYEPVWAIGEGAIPADPGYASRMHAHLRSVLIELFGRDSGACIPLLYGGSVNAHSAADLACQPDIDGLFIGRAGWTAESFLNIIQAAIPALGEHIR